MQFRPDGGDAGFDARRAAAAAAASSFSGAPPLRGGFPVDYGPRADDRRLGLASPVSKTVSYSGNSKGEEDDSQPSRHLWVGNVSQEVSEAILKEKFSQFGEVDNVTVYSSRNYAFVNFINQEDAVEAKNLLHGVMLGGLAMRIEFAKGVSNLPSPF
jgi:RNA recognition motif-containing protein